MPETIAAPPPQADPNLAAPASTPTLGDGKPASPGLDALLDDVSGGLAPPTPPTQPGVPQGTTAPDTTTETTLDALVPDAPAFLAGNAEKIEDWKSVKGLLKTAVTENKALQMEIQTLRDGGATGTAPGPAMPETDAVKALQTEVTDLKKGAEDFAAGAKELEVFKARDGIAGESSFQQKFDARRDELLKGIEAVATEAGVSEETWRAILNQTGEYAVSKMLDDTVSDTTARRLIGAKAVEFANLTTERAAALKTADPVADVRAWREKSATQSGGATAKSILDGKAGLMAAVGETARTMTADNGDLFYRTKAGRETAQSIAARAAEGRGYSAGEIADMAFRAESADAYKAVAAAKNARVLELEARMGGAPIGMGNPSAPPPTGDGSVDSFLPQIGGKSPFEVPTGQLKS